MGSSNHHRRGGALLAVLWLSAALAAIAFAVATSVRTETSRVGTNSEAMRAQYLASGSIDRAVLWILWGFQNHVNPDGSPKFYKAPMPLLRYQYPGGAAVVEVIPESGKLDINRAEPADIRRLLLALGAPPPQADALTESIGEWRAATGSGQAPPGFVSGTQQSTFPGRHASFEETEELLLVKGMTPELFYGQYVRDPEGRLTPRAGLRDSVSTYGQGNHIDINTAPVQLLVAMGGIPPSIAQQIAARRLLRGPYKNADEFQKETGLELSGRLGVWGGESPIVTLRATARARLGDGRLSEVSRTVSALVKFLPAGAEPPFHVLRWREEAWSPLPATAF